MSKIALGAGESAPGFRLQDQDAEWRSLEDYRGRWLVLFFYPKADTPGCTREACEFRDDSSAFEDLGASLIGVSLDRVGAQRRFAEKYRLPFPLLADADHVVAKRYGVRRGFGFFSFASRQSFLIDPQGTIARHYGKVAPKTHAGEILADLKSLI